MALKSKVAEITKLIIQSCYGDQMKKIMSKSLNVLGTLIYHMISSDADIQAHCIAALSDIVQRSESYRRRSLKGGVLRNIYMVIVYLFCI
jgi:hypothetical protein